MKNLQALIAKLPAYYIIVCEDNFGNPLLWNGAWIPLSVTDLEGYSRMRYIYLEEDYPAVHFSTLMKRGADVWETEIYDGEVAIAGVIPVKRTCRLLKIAASATVVKAAT